MEADYQLLTTTRYDPTLATLPWNDDCDGPSPYFLLPYHYERLQSAVEEHGWDIQNAHTYKQFKSRVVDTVSKQERNSEVRPPALRVCTCLVR